MEVMGEADSPKIVIERIKAIDNLDANILQADRADFFAIVRQRHPVQDPSHGDGRRPAGMGDPAASAG
jgi:hypothetical protein